MEKLCVAAQLKVLLAGTSMPWSVPLNSWAPSTVPVAAVGSALPVPSLSPMKSV
jgi:hypothetical protein